MKTVWRQRVITAPLRYGGRSANMNSSAINKHSAFRQVSASNPPQRKAAKRYHSLTNNSQWPKKNQNSLR